jgi:hypothetical protein
MYNKRATKDTWGASEKKGEGQCVVAKAVWGEIEREERRGGGIRSSFYNLRASKVETLSNSF